MGKEIRPKREELEFLYGLFVKGYQDSDILSKYLELEEAGKLTFPLRTDRRMVSKIREEFEVARSVLEPFLKQQLDPAFQKARDEHLASVRSNLEKWKATLSVKNIIQMYYNNEYSSILNAFRDQKSALWFTSITEHLPRSEFDLLWEKYDQFESTYRTYIQLYKKLRQQIIDEANVTFNIERLREKERLLFEADQDHDLALWKRPYLLKRTVPEIADSFTIPFFTAIQVKSLGKVMRLIFDRPHHYFLYQSKMNLEGLQVNDFEVLIAEDVSGENNSKYQSMVQKYLNSCIAADLLSTLGHLNQLVENVRATIDEILERRDYIHHTCRLCPASAKV